MGSQTRTVKMSSDTQAIQTQSLDAIIKSFCSKMTTVHIKTKILQDSCRRSNKISERLANNVEDAVNNGSDPTK